MKKQKPDLLFLDIKLGKENSFDLLAAIAPCTFPIIFVTAYEEYALKAFRWNAVDYLTKPIDSQALRQAVEKAIKYSAILNVDQLEGLQKMVMKQEAPDFIILRSEGQVERQLLKHIVYLQSDGGLTHLYCVSTNFLTQKRKLRRKTVSLNLGYHEKILPDDFFRCHQSYIVHRPYVELFNRYDSTLRLITGDAIPVARRTRPELEKWMVR